MRIASNFTARTADATTRTSTTAIRAIAPKSTPAPVGGAVRRLLNALMRSLATPHI